MVQGGCHAGENIGITQGWALFRVQMRCYSTISAVCSRMQGLENRDSEAQISSPSIHPRTQASKQVESTSPRVRIALLEDIARLTSKTPVRSFSDSKLSKKGSNFTAGLADKAPGSVDSTAKLASNLWNHSRYSTTSTGTMPRWQETPSSTRWMIKSSAFQAWGLGCTTW